MRKSPNLHDVAREAGVSAMTVSRFLNGSAPVGDNARQQITRAIKNLKYRPNQIAKSLQTRKTGNIAVLLGNISSPMSALTIKGIENVSFGNRYNLLIGNTEFSEEKERRYLDILMQKQIDGMILAPSSKEREPLEEIIDRGIPLLFLDRRVQGVQADYVGFDFENDSYNVTEHLINRGCRTISVICRRADLIHDSPQVKGFRRALERASIPWDKQRILYCHPSTEDAYRNMAEIMENGTRPDAVYIASSTLASGVLRYCRDKNILIPKDCMLACFDSLGEFDDLIRPNLTCNEVPAFDLGVYVAELLMRRIHDGYEKPDGPQHITLPGKLLIRESTGDTGWSRTGADASASCALRRAPRVSREAGIG